ncbi:MAG: molybdopterin-dependent oxidoreductase [Acidobacteria bacterium]|nr:molybdopterin-dependent oxidoreductase [Acidobacteriota bacterium]
MSRNTQNKESLNVVGKPLRKVDSRAKCTGQTIFVDDLFLPGMLFAKILRSTRPHALIRKIDTSRAEALSGVRAILLGHELPITFGILPVSQDEHTLAIEKVRYVGEPVAVVAADEEAIAEEAIRLIEVELEELPPVMSIREALDPSTPEIQAYGDGHNIHKLVSLEFGNVEEALSRSDVLLEDLFFYQGNTHLPMEQHCAVALWDPDDRLTLWSSTQTPHYVHRALARVLEVPAARIRVIACPNGGGFGGKSDPFSHEIAVAKLSMKTGKPVKYTATREEVFYCHRGRHPVLMKSRLGMKKNGTITGLEFQTVLDGGAYGSYGVASTFYTGALQTTTYQIPRYRFQGARVFTNKPPCGPKRGHGTPQPRFGLEVQLDKAAEKLGMDPAELRLKNLVQPNSLTANWLQIRTCSLDQCIEKVVEASSWKQKFRRLPFGRGVGLACSCYLTGAGLPIYWNSMPHSGVQLKLDRSGGVTVFCGSTDIGQGSDSVLAYIVAEVLGIDPFHIRVVTADTDLTPVDLGSYSSRVTLMTGNAAIQAAERARELLDEIAAQELKVPKERLAAAGGKIFDCENPEKFVPFEKAVQLAESKFGTIGTVGSYKPAESPGKYKGAGVGPSPTYSYSAAVVQVQVYTDTGFINVEKIWIAHDVGRALNPLLAIGQIEGSVYMALGEALMEEQEFRHGLHKIPSMLDYKSPTSADMCEVETFLVEEPDAEGPYGAKECGQGPLLPVPPALVNAIYDAVGIRIDEVPVTPEKVLKALRWRADGKAPRYGPQMFPQVPYPEAKMILPPAEGGDGRVLAEPASRLQMRGE